MARTMRVIVEQGIKVDGSYPPIGSEMALETKEAKRLLGLGAVSLPRPRVEAAAETPKRGKRAAAKSEPDPAEAELIAQIEAVQTEAELIALVDDAEERPAVVAAASAKLEALTAGNG